MSSKTSPHRLVSVVLGSYNRLTFLKATIESIRREVDGLNAEIIVIDGGSTDGTMRWLTRQKDIVTIIQHNRGMWRGKPIVRRSWGYFMNLGFKAVQGKYVCMLSDDCLVVPGAIHNGIDTFEKRLSAGDKIGAVAFFWRNWPEQRDYGVGLTLGHRMMLNHGLYLSSALADVGFADEDNFSFYHADGDLCQRMWDEGWTCIEAEDSYVEHFAHANLKVRQSNDARERADWNTYVTRWAALTECEPGYVGEWVEREYVDPYATIKQFPFWRYYLIRSHVVRYIRRLRECLRCLRR